MELCEIMENLAPLLIRKIFFLSGGSLVTLLFRYSWSLLFAHIVRLDTDESSDN